MTAGELAVLLAAVLCCIGFAALVVVLMRVLDSLKSLLTAHPGGTPVFLHIGAGKVIRLGGEFSVELDRVMGPLRAKFGDGAYVA